MRHAIGWADLAGVRVGVFGAGVEGQSALTRLSKLTTDVVVVDDDPNIELPGVTVEATDAGGFELLASCDVVIKSPGFSRYRPDIMALERSGIPVVGGTGLSMHELDRSKIICVTGTKGKSTTASVLGHLLTQFGLRTEVTGNIGRPLFDAALPSDLDAIVVETSSFQALDIADAPGIVVVTSLATDHVDWHGSIEQYHVDKLSLTSLPDAQLTVAQRLSPALQQRADLLGGDVRWSNGLAKSWAAPLVLVGDHNLANAELARLAALAFGVEQASDEEALSIAAQGFEPLPGRLSAVGTLGDVRFIDDSLATNVLPTLTALEALQGERLAILIGGYDRGVDYTELIEALAHRDSPTLVLGLPDSGERLCEAIGRITTHTSVTLAPDIGSGVDAAYAWAKPTGIVLLSPAAPSFSQFANWKERSDAFRSSVNDLLSRNAR